MQVPVEVAALDDVPEPALQGLGGVDERIPVLVDDAPGRLGRGLAALLALQFGRLAVGPGRADPGDDRADNGQRGGAEADNAVRGEIHADTLAGRRHPVVGLLPETSCPRPPL